MKHSPDSPVSNPRRPPAHLSVSLRHGNQPADSRLDSAQSWSNKSVIQAERTVELPAWQISHNGALRDDSSGVKKWFDQSNCRSDMKLDQDFTDDEPPYFLSQEDNSTSGSERCRNARAAHIKYALPPRIAHTATNDSSVEEYRSVIDDLTIENRKLRERLKKLEGSSRSSPHLEKDRLFEVKIHGLPADQRRELEDTLCAFAANINASTKIRNTNIDAKNTSQHNSRNISYKASSSSTTNSLPVDSAYASISNSGPSSTPVSNHARLEQNLGHRQNSTKQEKVESFLHNIPKGLLPKPAVVLTERQKKKAVVRRLEQLFTGRASGGQHSQPMQQQEVSNLATEADRAADGLSSVEGLREAHILPYEVNTDNAKGGVLHEDSSCETQIHGQSFNSTTSDDSSDVVSLDQRPTRPLDLDPDRAQIPSDNVDYIRHLGLSTAQFGEEDSSDIAAATSGDWLPLNLLMSMAQLHIMNVTPDLVRSAVQDISEKFQLSRDGQNIRWRGGTEGTRLSTDSDASSAREALHGSDSIGEANRKRRKVDIGRFAAAPVETSEPSIRNGAAQASAFHYRPLFRHQQSSEGESSSLDESDSPFERGMWYGSDLGKTSRVRQSEIDKHGSSSHRPQREDEGPIIFYSGAPFCTDLSGDKCNISTPHVTDSSKEGHSDHKQDALGCTSKKRPHPSMRTPSGSTLPYRPFKEYSKGSEFSRTKEKRPKSPEPTIDGTLDLDFALDWSTDPSNLDQPPRQFSASGLGGTRPADHFAAKVETRRTILDNSTRARLSKFSAPSPAARKFLHTIPKSILEIFQESERDTSSESIASGLTGLHAYSTPPLDFKRELPVKIELISAKFSHLEPSPLPAPSNYHSAMSSSDCGSDCSSSSSKALPLQGQGIMMHRARSFSPLSDPGIKTYTTQDLAARGQNMEDDEGELDEDQVEYSRTDSSIDMLA